MDILEKLILDKVNEERQCYFCKYKKDSLFCRKSHQCSSGRDKWVLNKKTIKEILLKHYENKQW